MSPEPEPGPGTAASAPSQGTTAAPPPTPASTPQPALAASATDPASPASRPVAVTRSAPSDQSARPVHARYPAPQAGTRQIAGPHPALGAHDLALNQPGAAAFARAAELAATHALAMSQLRERADSAADVVRAAAEIAEAEYRRARPIRAWLRGLLGGDRITSQVAAERQRIMALAPPPDPEAASFQRGAEGEAETGRVLAGLPPGWRTLHAVPVGTRGSDIDHVVFGPGGVFTLNTKHHRGKNVWVAGHTFMVSGQRQHYLRNSRHEGERPASCCTRPPGSNYP